MNPILKDIQKIIHENLKTYMPEVTFSMLESDGDVFFMNGKNGTEFDWYVNEHLPSMMVFYNEIENLGAVKADVYQNGSMFLYLYDEKGKHLLKETRTVLDISAGDLLNLAVVLRSNADDQRIWDASFTAINTDEEPSLQAVREFQNNQKYYVEMIQRRKLMNKLAVVSAKAIENRHVGYMVREEPHEEADSGWMFYAGNEDDAYTEDISHFALYAISSIAAFDPVILSYLDYPVGTRLVRTAEDIFEEDHGQQIYV